METGWIKVHRKIQKKGYYQKSEYVHLWVHLLLCATHESKEFMWNGELYNLVPGQFITGRKQLAEDTGIAETTIERILEIFEKDGQIGQQKTTKFRLITILNWEAYQKTGQQADNKRTTDGHNQECKNVKNVRKNTLAKTPPNPQVKEFIDFFDRAVKEIRGMKPIVNGLVDAVSIKRVLEKNKISLDRLERMAIWYLIAKKKRQTSSGWVEEFKHSPAIATMLSNSYLNQLINDERHAVDYLKQNLEWASKIFQKSTALDTLRGNLAGMFSLNKTL